MELPQGLRELLAERVFAWLTTLRSDGSAHNTIVWIDLDGDDLVFTTVVGRVKERNMRRDPRVVLSVLDPGDGYRFASIAGSASLETADLDRIRQGLTRKYRGPDARPTEVPGEQRVLVRVAPQSLISQGF
jgi:PPOX class probable F420-dependent enzyme